jgi:beta-phosphoglucomutase-like phosphatase (HAD superfamily)
MTGVPDVDTAQITTLLLDADGTLFASEQPAFVASAAVTRALAAEYGLSGDFSPEQLRRASTGQNFRSAAGALLDRAEASYQPAELEDWVQRERQAVTDHLSETLVGDADVNRAVGNWAQRYRLSVVSSSALSRLDACFLATGLAPWLPQHLRFSAEDSLTPPISKPDPAIYRHALTVLGCAPEQAVAIEDSTSGSRAALGAGITTLGIVQFAPPEERQQLRADLLELGVAAVADDWTQLESWL